MPDPAPRDYTTGELAEGADLLHEASDLLRPASDMLMHTANELIRSAKDAGDTDLGDQAVDVARTARQLTAVALHLKGGELTLRTLTRDVGRSYRAIRSRLLGLAFAALALSMALGLLSLLPGQVPHILGTAAPGPAAFAVGVSAAGWILHRRTRPPGSN